MDSISDFDWSQQNGKEKPTVSILYEGLVQRMFKVFSQQSTTLSNSSGSQFQSLVDTKTDLKSLTLDMENPQLIRDLTMLIVAQNSANKIILEEQIEAKRRRGEDVDLIPKRRMPVKALTETRTCLTKAHLTWIIMDAFMAVVLLMADLCYGDFKANFI